MLALLALQPPGFGTFAEPAPAVPGQLPERKSRTSTDASDGGAVGSDRACSDYGAWQGYDEHNCAYYAYQGWCPEYEDDVSADGIKAKDACCACGGGITDADETCRAIGYKQDDGLGEACEAIGYEQEDLAAQVAQLKAQSAQTNELLTQLAHSNAQLVQSAAQRNILELMSAKDAGRSAAALKAASFSAAALKAAGFSAVELNTAGIFTTNSELRAALRVATDTEAILGGVTLREAILGGVTLPSYVYEGINDACDVPSVDRASDCDMIVPPSDIENWDVSLIDDFSDLVSFHDVPRVFQEFNADLSEWDVSQGTNFENMFWGASSFDSDLSQWDVAKGTNFVGMFAGASSFNADLSQWNVAAAGPGGRYFINMFDGDVGCMVPSCGCTRSGGTSCD
jgi:hypothetical protein